MENNRKTLFILDDKIPMTQENIEKSVYSGRLNSSLLKDLVENAEWSGQHNLKSLTKLLLDSEHSESGNLDIYGFTHPSLCLDAIDEGLRPDIVVYDWEYGSEPHTQSAKWLMEILSSPDVFVFVYSNVRNQIPPFLNKSNFDDHAGHFQLFLKGGSNSSIFSTEEFIHQYVVSQITKSNKIRIQNCDILFKENGYLETPSDILFLERILGRLVLKEKLEQGLTNIDQESIEELVEDVNVKIYFDSAKSLLVTADSGIIASKITVSEELSSLDVLKRFGLETLKELLSIGIVKVE